MWDQALAIRWLKDNARGFGGDPDQVYYLHSMLPGANKFYFGNVNSIFR